MKYFYIIAAILFLAPQAFAQANPPEIQRELAEQGRQKEEMVAAKTIADQQEMIDKLQKQIADLQPKPPGPKATPGPK